ncbi:MAG: hypothetical protein V6Z89_19650 [Desulfobacter sp.]
MPIPKTARKGLGSIRTNMDRAFRGIPPHKAYLKIGSIEMEKARRMKEKDALMARLGVIETRCRELDEEKRRLLKVSGEKPSGKIKPPGPPATRPPAPRAAAAPAEKSSPAPATEAVADPRPPARIEAPVQKRDRAFSRSPGGLRFKY